MSNNNSVYGWDRHEQGARGTIMRYIINHMQGVSSENAHYHFPLALVSFLPHATRRLIEHEIIQKFHGSTEPLHDPPPGDEKQNRHFMLLAKHWDTIAGRQLRTSIQAKAEPIIRKLECSVRAKHWNDRFMQLQRLFDLSNTDIGILKLLFCFGNIAFFYKLCEKSDITPLNVSFGSSESKLVDIVQFTGISRHAVRAALASHGNLRKLQLLDHDLEPREHVSDFLWGNSRTPLAEKMFHQLPKSTIPLTAHTANASHLDRVVDLIRGCQPDDRLNILFYGKPGTGKTELAKSLATHLDRNLFEVRSVEQDDDPGFSTGFRVGAFHACLSSVPHDSSIVLIDEAENLLGGSEEPRSFFGFLPTCSGNKEKSMTNDLLDNGPGIRIWIVNHRYGMDSSALRRFDYAIEFEALTRTQREEIWRSSIKRHRLDKTITQNEVIELADRYDVTPGGMDVALRNYNRLVHARKINPTAPKRLQLIHELLTPHLKLMGITLDSISKKTAANYSLEGLQVKGPIPPAQCLDMARKFLSRPAYQNDCTLRNFNLLLSGPPGTGKSEFAKHLANELGRPLVMVSASEMLNCYVGGTESNIRTAFQRAETEKAILFFDEADSLLQSRDTAHRSWEVTQVNELLCRMEAFHGVFICATNAKPKLDTASLRRFAVKLEFDYLDTPGKQLFFTRILGDLAAAPPDICALRALDAIPNLAPGDFKVVRQQFALLDGRPSAAELINRLSHEAVIKRDPDDRQKIGF